MEYGMSVSPWYEDFSSIAKDLIARGRGLHSSTFQANLSLVGHTSACTPV